MLTMPWAGFLKSRASLRIGRRLARVERGASLVRRKRDALVRELFRLAHPAADVRVRINMEFADACEALLRAHDRISLGHPVVPTRRSHLVRSAEALARRAIAALAVCRYFGDLPAP